MVQIYLKQFPSGTIKMLHVRNAGPFKILNKLNCNTYVIGLLRDYGISCTFNINDLVDYKGFEFSPLVKPSPKPLSERPPLTPLSDTHPITTEVLEDETITTKAGRTYRYLDRCKGKAPAVDSQSDQDDLQLIDPVSRGVHLSRRGLSILQPRAKSILPPRENDAGILPWRMN